MVSASVLLQLRKPCHVVPDWPDKGFSFGQAYNYFCGHFIAFETLQALLNACSAPPRPSPVIITGLVQKCDSTCNVTPAYYHILELDQGGDINEGAL